MTKQLLISALVAGLGIVAAAPQTSDGVGVTVDLGSAAVLHRTPITYSVEGIRAKREGSILAEVTLDGVGNVQDARILSGPNELRKTVMQSLLQWHFATDSGATTRQVKVTFQMPDVAKSGNMTVVTGGTAPSFAGRTLDLIQMSGLTDEAKARLQPRLALVKGAPISDQAFNETVKAVQEYDDHIMVRLLGGKDDTTVLMISSPGGSVPGPATPAAGPGVPSRITVGGNVQSARLISQPKPVYPAAAKEARISGTVKLSVVIAKDGSVMDISVVSGHPLFIPPSLDAVRFWRYQPTLLNGEPVEVATQIDVNFTLSQ